MTLLDDLLSALFHGLINLLDRIFNRPKTPRPKRRSWWRRLLRR